MVRHYDTSAMGDGVKDKKIGSLSFLFFYGLRWSFYGWNWQFYYIIMHNIFCLLFLTFEVYHIYSSVKIRMVIMSFIGRKKFLLYFVDFKWGTGWSSNYFISFLEIWSVWSPIVIHHKTSITKKNFRGTLKHQKHVRR